MFQDGQSNCGPCSGAGAVYTSRGQWTSTSQKPKFGKGFFYYFCIIPFYNISPLSEKYQGQQKRSTTDPTLIPTLPSHPVVKVNVPPDSHMNCRRSATYFTCTSTFSIYRFIELFLRRMLSLPRCRFALLSRLRLIFGSVV